MISREFVPKSSNFIFFQEHFQLSLCIKSLWFPITYSPFLLTPYQNVPSFLLPVVSSRHLGFFYCVLKYPPISPFSLSSCYTRQLGRYITKSIYLPLKYICVHQAKIHLFQFDQSQISKHLVVLNILFQIIKCLTIEHLPSLTTTTKL